MAVTQEEMDKMWKYFNETYSRVYITISCFEGKQEMVFEVSAVGDLGVLATAEVQGREIEVYVKMEDIKEWNKVSPS